MKELEQTLDSREVAEMVEKIHKDLMRDIRRYTKQFTECNIAVSDFFRESEYKDSTGRTLPCYNITKKGCEFIAHKLTGTKGTAFTARYINRFHEMQDMITQAAEPKEKEPELPWFIKKFRGRYVILWRDFEKLTGMELSKKKIRGWAGNIIMGRDFCGWATKDTIIKEDFKKEYGFDYGDDDSLTYFTLSGVKRVIRLLYLHNGAKIEIDSSVVKLLLNEIAKIEMESKERVVDFLWNISNLIQI